MFFCKMNGAGNDFIILDNMDGSLNGYDFSRMAKELCHRRFSVGADGLMVVEPASQGGDFSMRFFNSDGSMGEMCGNGARCICRFGFESGYAGKTQHVETTAGMVTGSRLSRTEYRIRLNDPSQVLLREKLLLDGRELEASYVELGRPGIPHAVVPMEQLGSLSREELFALGRQIRHYPDFPKGANVNFCRVTGMNQAEIFTYERGVEDFTLACGTGSGSAALALVLTGAVKGPEVRMQTEGGLLTVGVDIQGDTLENLWLTGPTKLVCRGELTD